MTALAAIFYAIGGIAIAAILCAMRLLDQRSKLRKALVTAGAHYAVLEAINSEQADVIAEYRFREEKLNEHCVKLIHERNVLRAQLVAYSEPPRFGFVRSGSA